MRTGHEQLLQPQTHFPSLKTTTSRNPFPQSHFPLLLPTPCFYFQIAICLTSERHAAFLPLQRSSMVSRHPPTFALCKNNSLSQPAELLGSVSYNYPRQLKLKFSLERQWQTQITTLPARPSREVPPPLHNSSTAPLLYQTGLVFITSSSGSTLRRLLHTAHIAVSSRVTLNSILFEESMMIPEQTRTQ